MRVIILTMVLLAQPVSAVRQAEKDQPTAAPGFALKDLKSRTSRLGDYKGKVLLVNFWATWCVPCKVEMPELMRLQREYRSRGLQVIGITFPPERRRDVVSLSRRLKLNYPILFGTPEVAEAYEVGDVLPTTIVVDRDGKIRARVLGILEPEEFKEKVAPLLEGK